MTTTNHFAWPWQLGKPSRRGSYIISAVDDEGGRWVTEFVWRGDEWRGPEFDNPIAKSVTVVAWMPWPEPYNEAEQQRAEREGG